jgi:ribonuclease-3
MSAEGAKRIARARPAPSAKAAKASQAVEAELGRKFRRPALLQEALTHSSAGEGNKAARINNERQEFLGDRVLGLVVAERLYKDFAQEGESGLAPRLNALVNRSACARAARRANLGASLIVSRSEEAGGGRDKETILADACEAVIAALYLDGGLKAAREFIEKYWADEFDAVAEVPQDAKTVLQEWAAATKRGSPRYVVLERSGPDHAPRFKVEASVNGEPPAQGEGGSKREAERAAAFALLAAAGVHV